MMMEADSPERHLELRGEESHTEHEQQGEGRSLRAKVKQKCLRIQAEVSWRWAPHQDAKTSLDWTC
jgi:hypothetical protein